MPRRNILEVIDFLEKDLNINNNTILVLDGGYETFLLFLNRPMNNDRFLFRKSNLICYDISQNTYVQSNYFRYNELSKAINDNREGYYITSESKMYDENKNLIVELEEKDLIINNIILNFIKEIDRYKVYSWKI